MPRLPGLQLVERHAWIPAIGAEYLLGIDGLSLLLVLLTSLVFPFAFLAQRMGRGFCALMLRHAGGALRHLHRAEFRSLVFVLRDEPDPGVPAHQNLGRRKSRPRRDEIFSLHVSRERRDAALVSRHLSSLGELSILRARGISEKRDCFTGNIAWLAFAGIFLGLAVKVPLFPISHLAARRIRNRADRRLDGPDRCALENGRLRIRSPAAAAFP